MLCSVALLTACGPPPDPERPHLVLLMLDAARADFFGSYGHPFNTTPEMDRLAAGGMRFAHHVSHGHTTRQSVPQLFTSRYDPPSLLYFPPGQDEPWWRRDEVPQDDLVLLPQVLSDAGYRTVMVTAHPWTIAESQLGASFQEVHFVKPKSGPHADAQALVAKAQGVLREHVGRGEAEPLFLYVHFLDTHTPHNPPEEDEFFSLEALGWNRGQWARLQPARKETKYIANPDPVLVETFKGAIRSSLRSLDTQIGSLMESVERRLGTKVVAAITADHGDALGEGGHFEHTLPTFGMDAVHHIPLLLFGEGVPKGTVIQGFTGTVDVMPTLLDLAGITPPKEGHLDGHSLVSRQDPEAVTRDGVGYTYRSGWRSTRFGFRDADQTWILTEREQVFRLTETDSGVEKELVGSARSSAAELPREFKRFIKTYLQREAQRKVVTEVGPMHIPAREIASPLGPQPECWDLGDIDDWNRKIKFSSRDQQAEPCPALALRVAVPAGEYGAKWRLDIRKGHPKVFIRHSRGQTVVAESTGAMAVELGEVEVRDSHWQVDVQVQGNGAEVVFGAFDWQRLGSTEADLETDTETLEQLKSLGYLD